MVEARSNVGPILFGTSDVTGVIEAPVDGHVLDPAPAWATLEVDVSRLASGNQLYDSELRRRIDARRYPMSVVRLLAAEATEDPRRFRVSGDITFHGVTRTLHGAVSVAVTDDGLVITGEEEVDIREFEMAAPTMLMLKIRPEVRVRLHVEAELVDTPAGTPASPAIERNQH